MGISANHKSFFCNNNNVEDPLYKFIRDGKEDHHQEARKFVEELWQIYKPYAETEFLTKVKEDFHAKTWEMYLGGVFLKHGLNLQRKNKTEGPDTHLLWNNQSIWIEAVAPTSGSGENKVPEYNYNEASDTPIDKVILRLTSAIGEKYEKYNKYIYKGTIKPNDFYIIAVNGGRIPHSIAEENIPYIVKSVFPFGDLVLTLKKDSRKIVGSRYEYRDTITTAKGSSVSTSIFENNDYSGISAILYSWMNVVTRPNEIGVEIQYVHNPFATNKLPLGIFPFGCEWWVEGEFLNKKEYKI